MIIFLTYVYYNESSFIKFIFLKRAIWAGLIAITGTVAEIAQNYGLYHGTFDVKDIPMYFIGAGMAYGVDKLTYKDKEQELEDKL